MRCRLVLWLGFFLSVAAGRGFAGGIEISMADGDPHDRIWLHNAGDCTLVAGALVLDFRGSVGHIVIDTAYGGIGTKDPMPIEVERGNITVAPVADGDTEITVLIDGIAPSDTEVVTLDFDNNRSGWFSRKVSILGEDVVGTEARFETPGGVMRGTFTQGPVLTLDIPKGACEVDNPPPVMTPIS